MTRFKVLLLAGLSLILFSNTGLAEESQTERAEGTEANKLQQYKDAVSERQNPNTGVTFETVDHQGLPQNLNWSEQYLPILGQAARERGYVLPLPLGISVNHATIAEPLEITRVGIRGSSGSGGIYPPASLVSLGDVNATNINVRLDAWVLPFLNFYLIAGKTDGDTDVTVTLPSVQIPSGCSVFCLVDFPGASRTFGADFEGDTYGAGMTLAGGYGDFFGVFDVNYTESDIDILIDDARATIYSARAGWNGNVLQKFNGAFWVGGLKQDVDQTVVVPLSYLAAGAKGEIVVDVESKSNITPIAGARWDIARDWNVMTEYGWGDRDFLLFSAGYRF